MSLQGEGLVNYEEWEQSVPDVLKMEIYWRFIGYQKALFFFDLVWRDIENWIKDVRGRELARQIVRSAGSISANIEEGHGRGYGKQYLQFFNYALASARETKGWYWRARHLMTAQALDHRLGLAGEIVALIVTEINTQKHHR